MNPVSWYEENGVELRTGTNVMSLDPEARTVKLQGGGRGGVPEGADRHRTEREHPGGGRANLDRIHYLRTFGELGQHRADAEKADRVVLVGGSYIACEVAASLKSKGTDCALVMMEDVASRGPSAIRAGRWFQDCWSRRGSSSTAARRSRRSSGERPRERGPVTESGETMEGDMVVVGAG